MSGRQDIHEYSRLVEEELKPLANKHGNKMWGRSNARCLFIMGTW